jgi:hypothetical protein
LRELIDEALEEIERTELEMLDLLSDVLGPEPARRVAEQIGAAEQQPRFARLLRSRGHRSPDARSDP